MKSFETELAGYEILFFFFWKYLKNEVYRYPSTLNGGNGNENSCCSI